jgi:hypothetical protein
MINNPKLIKEIIENIKKISKEDLENAMKQVDEEWARNEVEKDV